MKRTLLYLEGASGISGVVMSWSSDVQLDHVTLERSGTAGLYADHASVPVTDSTIRDNLGYGLRYVGLDGTIPLVVTDNEFVSTGANAGVLPVVRGQQASLHTVRYIAANSPSENRWAQPSVVVICASPVVSRNRRPAAKCAWSAGRAKSASVPSVRVTLAS